MSEPDKRLGHSEILRAVKTDSTSNINRSITFSEDLNNMSANTEKTNTLFFVSSQGIKAQIAFIRNEENIRISFLCCVSSVADDLTKLVLVVLM